jgi:uncharacterized protein
MARAFAEIAFTSAVRAEQARHGSAESYAKHLAPEAAAGDRLGPAETAFVSQRDGFYQATVSETGWPYVQFRGGPRGFLKVLDEQTLAYADFRGNRQYLSVGNLKGDDRIALILVDYPNRRRLKVWGHVRIVGRADDPELVARLHDASYRALPERAIVITIAALDWNCQQHLPERYTLEELEPALAQIRHELQRLRAENDALRGAAAMPG